MSAAIKRIAAVLACLTFALSETAGGDFTQTLNSEDMRSTGLAKLTQEELLQLEIRVERYKAGVATTSVNAKTATAPAAQPPSKSTKILPSWVGALVTLERVGNQPDKSDAMESRLTGKFAGWSGRTSFELENGQRWVQANNDTYAYTPTLESPKVEIYPASLGTYWLEIEGIHQRCRVKPVKLQ